MLRVLHKRKLFQILPLSKFKSKKTNKPTKPFRAAPFNTIATRHTGY